MTRHLLWTACFTAAGLLIGATAVADEDQGQRRGTKAKETLADDLKIPQQGVAVLHATKGNKTSGVILLRQTEEGVHLHGMVRGLEPGKHGFHIHEFGDLRAPDGTSAGGHFNPTGAKHGGPTDEEHHVGDLGNIEAQADGTAKVDIMAKGLKLHFVVGRSIVVHGGADDFESQPSGDAGPRVALGVIGFAGPAESETRKTSTEKLR